MTKAQRGTIGVALVLAWANLAVSQEQQAFRDIPYVEGGHERNCLDLYLPKETTSPVPLVVWIHGGGWEGGSKEDCPALSLVGKGYAVASINYRLSQHAPFPAQIEDCKEAIRWLRANATKYHIDASHIGVWGGSAGGHLAALLGVTGDVKELDGRGGHLNHSSRVQCVVDWFGPTDFVRWDPDFNGRVYSMITRLLDGDPRENKQMARQASPVAYVDDHSAPFLIVHGTEDNLVPFDQSQTLADALCKCGVDVTLQIINNAGHGGPEFTNSENSKRIEDFFAKHLGKAKQ